MSDCEYERVLRMNLERDDVRKALDDRSANAEWRGGGPWPNRKGRGGLPDPIEHVRHLGNELVAKRWAPLIVPYGCGAKLCARFRMQFDAHDAL